MSVTKTHAYLSEQEICPTLAQHIIDFAQKHEVIFGDEDAITTLNEFLNAFYEPSIFTYYSEQKTTLINTCNIEVDFQKLVFVHLEDLAKFYVLYSMSALDRFGTTEILNDLRKIAKAAENLKALIPKKNSKTFALLATIDHLEKNNNLTFDQKDNAAYVFLDHTIEVLDEYIRLPNAIPKSQLGQLLKIGVKSAKGNLALRLWVENSYRIWIKVLERNLKFDGKHGVNGRKRFLEFSYTALIVIHPNISFSKVENAVTLFLRNGTKT